MELKKEELMSLYNAKNHVEDRKVKKFFRVTIPILIIEILGLVCIGIYYFTMPKNFCKISIDVQDSIIYVNNKETKRFLLNEPKSLTDYYFYKVDVSVMLPGDEAYAVEYVLKCDKYEVSATTTATKNGNVYSMEINGGEKTELLSAITIKASEMIKDFDVSIEINAKRI